MNRKDRVVRISRTKHFVALAVVTSVFASAAHAAFTISNTKTKNVTCAGGVCTPTGSNANLNTGALQTLLAASDVTVKSNAAAPDIGIADPLTWASSHRLTLDAYASIHVRVPVVVEGTSGLTLITNDGGTGGDYTFNTTTSGAITFWDTASSLVINGKNYVLVSNIKTLASAIAAHPARSFALSNDYDASPNTYRSSPVSTVFAGTFEGLGHTISNFTIKTGNDRQTGLFAQLDPRGTLRDIGLVNANVTADHSSLSSGIAGALVAQNDGRITHAYATGSVWGRRSVTGGLAGSSTGTIAMSYSTANVGCLDGQGGGLVGTMQGGLVESSHATGAIGCDGSAAAGGLVGSVGAGRILYSFATGKASAFGRRSTDGAVAGGLTAGNAGTIAFSFATGDTSAYGSEGESDGAGYAGGLTAHNRGTIHDSYATGKASAGPYSVAGGLAEENDGSISNSYSTGTVSASQRGGLLGQDYSTTANSYWNLDTSGISDPHQGAGDPLDDPGITGLTDAELKSALPAGFDPNIWGQNASINNGWPYLLANPPQ